MKRYDAHGGDEPQQVFCASRRRNHGLGVRVLLSVLLCPYPHSCVGVIRRGWPSESSEWVNPPGCVSPRDLFPRECCCASPASLASYGLLSRSPGEHCYLHFWRADRDCIGMLVGFPRRLVRHALVALSRSNIFIVHRIKRGVWRDMLSE